MLLSAVIVCCAIVVNAESPLNSHSSFAGDSNGYDYSNAGTGNGYLGSKDNYGGSFYAGGGITGNHELSNHVGGHSLINPDNQGSIGSDSYNGYSSSGNHESEYAGYSSTYENSNGDSYTLSTRATPTSFRGYSGSSSAFKAYPSDSVYKESEFGNQYAAASGSNIKRIPYSGYSRPAMLENYSKGSVDSDIVQGYRGSSDAPSYSESDHVYSSSYSPDNLAGEHSFAGKQKDGPYSLKSGGKYSDTTVYSVPSETRYTRGNIGNVGHTGYGHDVPSYALSARPSNYLSKAPGMYVSSGKPSKYYGYNKYLSRHAPNSGVTYYLSRERDSYYAPYAPKGSGKVIIVKDNRPNYGGGHVYSDEPLYSGSYRSKSGGHMTGYPASPTFDGYSAGGNSYDDSPALTRRYRNSGGPILVQKKIYP